MAYFNHLGINCDWCIDLYGQITALGFTRLATISWVTKSWTTHQGWASSLPTQAITLLASESAWWNEATAGSFRREGRAQQEGRGCPSSAAAFALPWKQSAGFICQAARAEVLANRRCEMRRVFRLVPDWRQRLTSGVWPLRFDKSLLAQIISGLRAPHVGVGSAGSGGGGGGGGGRWFVKLANNSSFSSDYFKPWDGDMCINFRQIK